MNEQLDLFETMVGSAVEKVVTSQSSHSTYSDYNIFKRANGNYGVLSFSDHYSDTHDCELGDLVFDLVEDGKVDSEKDIWTFLNIYASKTLESLDVVSLDDIYFGFETINETYTPEYAESLVGKKNIDRAFVSDEYTVQTTELIEDNHVLKVNYGNSSEFYIGFKLNTGEEADLINGFMHSTLLCSASDLRRYYYSDKYDILSKNDLLEEIKNAFDLEDEDGAEAYNNYLNADFEELCNDWFEGDMLVEEHEAFKTKDGKEYVVVKYGRD